MLYSFTEWATDHPGKNGMYSGSFKSSTGAATAQPLSLVAWKFLSDYLLILIEEVSFQCCD
jgi:hypothetical protein